jgi:hypothetical protein
MPAFIYRPKVPVARQRRLDVLQMDYEGARFQSPLKIKWEDEKEWWQFPLDPIVTISGRNVIARRNVMKIGNAEKRRGTIKELWTQDDYEINISGVFINEWETQADYYEWNLPEWDLRKLRNYCEERKTLQVQSELFTIYNITKIAIESYSLPFTEGVENQKFLIKAYSDDDYDFFIKE